MLLATPPTVEAMRQYAKALQEQQLQLPAHPRSLELSKYDISGLSTEQLRGARFQSVAGAQSAANNCSTALFAAPAPRRDSAADGYSEEGVLVPIW